MLTGHNSPGKALAYLQMNLKFYPDYSKSYVALGNFYLMQENQKEAILYVEKAVEMDDNAEAREKLNELKEAN